MNANKDRYTFTGTGLALGTALGLLLWVLTGSVVYIWLGAALGLVIGATGDGFAQDQRGKRK